MATISGKTNYGLIDYCRKQLGKPYWWGTSGQISTRPLLQSLRKLYKSQYEKPMYANAESQLGVKVHDCMGLIEGYFWSDDPNSAAKYNSNGFADTTADRLLASATEKGDISTIPEIPGLSVHMKGHVGVYEGNGMVIEARGHEYGVVRTKLNERPWTAWAKIPQLEYQTPQQAIAEKKHKTAKTVLRWIAIIGGTALLATGGILAYRFWKNGD